MVMNSGIRTISDGPFAGLPYRQAKVILIDPPTKFSSGPNKNPERHYRTMKLQDIAKFPVRDLADPTGCRMFLWTTAPLAFVRFSAREMATRWGFRYSTCRIWAKLWPREDTMFLYPNSISRGSGYETTGDFEILSIWKIGKPESLRKRAKPRGLFYGRRREHSRKPDNVIDEITSTFEGPRIELFARESRPGWVTWGDQKQKFDRAAE